MDADDREVRERALQTWLKEHTSDVRQDRAALYAKTFYDNNASTIVRVGKKVRDKTWLIQLQIDPDDADDIVTALRTAKLIPPSNESGDTITSSNQPQKTQNSSKGNTCVGSARESVNRSDASSPLAR